MKINGVRVDNKGCRPWAAGKREGPRGREPKHPISPKEQAEIAKCLTCTRPECPGHCTRTQGRKRLSVPEDFAKRAQAGATTKALQQHYGVSNTPIRNWRREVGLAGGTKKQPPTELEPLTGGK